MSQTSVLVQRVDDAYSSVAKNGMEREYTQRVAQAFGYTAEELQSVPEESNLGLSCGNPTATAHLRPGEHVVDLGSGGGLDCFLAASQVGTSGQVVGLDMSHDMISLARRNATRMGLSPPQVDFRYAQFGSKEPLPIRDASVDCILSNCVLNLVESSRKASVLVELFRILRPGGRLAVHDILSNGDMDENLKENMNLYIGCISGAVSSQLFEHMLREAGFTDIVFVDNKSDLNIYFQDGGVGCCGPQNQPVAPAASNGATSSSCCKPKSTPAKPSSIDLATFDANQHASSFSIYAIKPGSKFDGPAANMLH